MDVHDVKGWLIIADLVCMDGAKVDQQSDIHILNPEHGRVSEVVTVRLCECRTCGSGEAAALWIRAAARA